MSPNVNSVTVEEKNDDEKQKTFETGFSRIIALGNVQRMKIKFRSLPEKKFEIRNSLLTDLFETNLHIKTIHHIFISTLMGLFVNTVLHDYLKRGEIKLGFHLIYKSFGKVYIAIFAWVGFFLTTCCCYLCFILWARVRIKLFPKSNIVKVWDCLWLLPLIGYYILSFRLSSSVVTTFQLPPASAAIVLLEQIRLLMKLHAFVRTNVPRVLTYKSHSDQLLNLPEFSKFLYFLFAPTIVYRDEYPRTKTIRWNFVMYRILEIAGVIFYYSFLLGRFLFPIYEDFGIRKYTWGEIILSIFENGIIGLVILLSTFFLILHSVQNLFAELLYFGDRMFYRDWWTCTSYSEYFRTWNIVVHDWLYTYIYKDMYETVVPRKKTVGKLMVFIISAVVHEWVLSYMFGFFIPALFIQFFFGGALFSFINAPKITILNILFWYGLAFGSGSLLSMYTLEFYARMNTPVKNSTLLDYLLPRWLTCDCIH